MLPEDVADARAVAFTGRREWAHVRLMQDNELGVVRDPPAAVQRPHEIVDLLTGAPLRAGAQPELLVECSDTRDHGGTEKDRERDRAVPEVLASQHSWVALP